MSDPRGKVYLKEDTMLADFVTWTRNNYPMLRKAFFHIENEDAHGSALTGAISLAKGRLKGVFDIEFVYRGFMFFVEFKLPIKGVWSPTQKELKELWQSWGIPVIECRNFETWFCICESVKKEDWNTIKILGL